jgi:hypothetical protein
MIDLRGFSKKFPNDGKLQNNVILQGRARYNSYLNFLFSLAPHARFSDKIRLARAR